MPLWFRWRDATRLPVDASRLRPEELAGISPSEASKLSVRVGRESVDVGTLFDVSPWEAAGADDALGFEGDLACVAGLGRGMTRGQLLVEGTAGDFLAAGLAGGTVTVRGGVGHWAAAEMTGGMLRIQGNAGDGLGAALPGTRLGMRDGVILVEGKVGDGAGRRMRRGLIAVTGAAGDGLGADLIAGSIFVGGPVAGYPGTAMKRGTLVLFGDAPARLLPTFVPTGHYRFPFLALYARQLGAWGFALPPRVSSGEVLRYNGDLAVGGHGEVLVSGGGGGG